MNGCTSTFLLPTCDGQWRQNPLPRADSLLLLSISTGLAISAAGLIAIYLLVVPWIDTVHEDDWEDDLAALKDEVIDPKWGRVDWIMRIHSLDAGSMQAHNTLYRQAMRGTATLRKVEREMIALVVSKANDCTY